MCYQSFPPRRELTEQLFSPTWSPAWFDYRRRNSTLYRTWLDYTLVTGRIDFSVKISVAPPSVAKDLLKILGRSLPVFPLCVFVREFESAPTGPPRKLQVKCWTQLDWARRLIVAYNLRAPHFCAKLDKEPGRHQKPVETVRSLFSFYCYFTPCHFDDDPNRLLSSSFLGRVWITMASGDGDWVVAPLIEAAPPSLVPPALFVPQPSQQV